MKRVKVGNEENYLILGKHIERNKRIYQTLMVIISVFELILFIRGIFRLTRRTYNNYVYLTSYIFLFISSMGMLAYLSISDIKKGGYKFCNVVMHLYSAAIVLWSIIISSLDMKSGDFPIVYLTVIVTLSSVVVLEREFFAVLCLVSFMALIGADAMRGFNFFVSTGEYINLGVFMTMAIIINGRLYIVSVKEFRSNETLKASVREERNRVAAISLQTIKSIINTVDAKDKYTREHSQRVAEYSTIIARKMRWDEDRVNDLHEIALLHDIGKIGVPDSILNYTGQLSSEEFEQMKQHTIIGGEILKDLTILEHVGLGAQYHHERYDGTGYPSGLMGAEIPIEARIIAVADSFDAMSSNRIYREHLSKKKILTELEEGKGKQFDPEIIDLFMPDAIEILNRQGIE